MSLAGTPYPSPGAYVSMAAPVVLISLFTSFKGIFGPSRVTGHAQRFTRPLSSTRRRTAQAAG